MHLASSILACLCSCVTPPLCIHCAGLLNLPPPSRTTSIMHKAQDLSMPRQHRPYDDRPQQYQQPNPRQMQQHDNSRSSPSRFRNDAEHMGQRPFHEENYDTYNEDAPYAERSDMYGESRQHSPLGGRQQDEAAGAGRSHQQQSAGSVSHCTDLLRLAHLQHHGRILSWQVQMSGRPKCFSKCLQHA